MVTQGSITLKRTRLQKDVVETKKLSNEKYLLKEILFQILLFDSTQISSVLEADVFIDGATGLTTKKSLCTKTKQETKQSSTNEVILG